MKNRFMGYEETATFLNMKVGTLYAKVCRKEVPHVRLSGRCVRFDLDELQKWIDDHKIPAEDVLEK
ncbi:MAG: helix-turn-helix domain-containing protein [Deltaproteobacteria bacterium]|nr:helix-turn-helix domain-containing protein [Deltaproteobacteria bacterium]